MLNILNLENKINGLEPINREELFKLVSSWGRFDSFFTFDDIEIYKCEPNECYDLSNLLHTSKHSFGISFLDSKNSYNKQLLYFTKLALICKQIIFNFYFYLVSQITDLSYIFRESLYNGDLSKWNVSSCKDMEKMFSFSLFNNNSLNSWNCSNVVNMETMFYRSKFNGDISSWNVSNVLYMTLMFDRAFFDGDISKWKFHQNLECEDMFYGNENFEKKYNNKEEIPTYNIEEFIKWFEENRNKIASLNISKDELIDIDDYLDTFERKELTNEN